MSTYPARTLPYMQRSCFLVSDLDKSLTLYRDLLGFKLEYLDSDGPDAFSYEIFNIDRSKQTRFATFSTADQLRTLALIEVPELNANPTQTPVAASVVHVDSVDNTIEAAKVMGLSTSRILRELTPQSGPARAEAAIYDFDGHPVVIYQLIGE